MSKRYQPPARLGELAVTGEEVPHCACVDDERDDAHLCAADGACQSEGLVDAGQQQRAGMGVNPVATAARGAE